MAFTTFEGWRVGNNEPVDDRMVFNTVAAALTPNAPTLWLHPDRRHEGLPIWIKTERKLYRFIGGTEDEHLVEDAASTEMIRTIIETLFETETLLETFFEKIVEKLLDPDNDALLDKMKQVFWTKDELQVKTSAEYDAAVTANEISEGTVVMVKQ
jgi:hypothetical protein